MRGRILDLLINALLLVVSSSVTVGAIELGVRIYTGLAGLELPFPSRTFGDNPNSPVQVDSVLGWSLRPGFRTVLGDIQVNSLGLRSTLDWPQPDLPPCTRKVLVLGDSMVFGPGVSQQHIFTEILNQERGGSLYVNAGVIGYSNGQEYLVQQELSKLIDFDIAILFFTEENDLWWNGRTTNFNAAFSIEDGSLVAVPPKPYHDPPWYYHSMFFRLLDLKLIRGKDWDFLIQRADFELRGRDSHPWRLAEAILTEMKRTADQHGYPLLVVDIPTSQQTRTGKGGERQALLRAAADRLGMGYFDLLDYYPEPPDALFLTADSHWSEHGHRFIAQFVTRMLPPHGCESAAPAASGLPAAPSQ